MKKILLIFFCFTSLLLYSQTTYEGKIIDNKTGESLTYVNVGIVGKNIGTVSNHKGYFEIAFDDSFDEDTLRISMIGYHIIELKVAQFKALILQNPIIKLQQKANEIQQIVILDKKLKEKTLGNKITNKFIQAGFSSNELGNEVGIKIKIKKSPTYLKNFNVSIASNKYDSLKFRINIYNLKKGIPDQNILKENIVVSTKIKEGILTVDLSKYNIVVEEDFFVSLEWIEDLGEKGLYFSAGLIGTSIIARQTSQGNWEKVRPLSLGIFMDVSH